MNDTTTFDVVKELAMLSKTVNFSDFYNIDIRPTRPEIRLQGTIGYNTSKAAKDLGISLEFDSECVMLRGNNGNIYITLTL